MKYNLIVCAALLTGCASYGQIRMKLSTDRKEYLPYELVQLTVLIENNTGNTLQFPKANDKLREGYIACQVSDEQGLRTRRTSATSELYGKDGKVNFARGLVLPAGTRREMTIPISRYFAMDKPQHYTFVVRVSHKRLSRDYVSQSASINIIPGVTANSIEVGVPSTKGEIQKRTCSLISYHGKKTTEYALKVEDKKMVYCIHRLAPHISGDYPQIQVDARSQIHIIIHTEAQIFRYWLFDIDGKLKQSIQYEFTAKLGIPKLLRDPDIGRVRVYGGKRIVPGQEADVRLPPLERKPKK